MKTYNRILIVKLGSIGDIVHTLPAVSALRRHYPRAAIDWSVDSTAKTILEDSPIIDNLIEIGTHVWRKNPLNPSTWSLIKKSIHKLRRAQYDLALDFQGLLKSALISFLSGAPERIGFSRNHLKEPMASVFYTQQVSPSEEKTHIIDKNNSLVEFLGINVENLAFPFSIGSQDSAYVHEQLSKNNIREFVILNPGGGWPTKLWHAEKYAALSRKMYSEFKLKSVITVSKNEEWLLKQIQAQTGHEHVVFFPTTIKQLIPLVKNALCFVSGDTGPLHIAAALGIPLVGIFGPTRPERNGSFNASDLSLSKSGLLCLGCYKQRCPFQTTACMEIPVDVVFHAVADQLKRSRKAAGIN